MDIKTHLQVMQEKNDHPCINVSEDGRIVCLGGNVITFSCCVAAAVRYTVHILMSSNIDIEKGESARREISSTIYEGCRHSVKYAAAIALEAMKRNGVVDDRSFVVVVTDGSGKFAFATSSSGKAEDVHPSIFPLTIHA